MIVTFLFGTCIEEIPAGGEIRYIGEEVITREAFNYGGGGAAPPEDDLLRTFHSCDWQ